MSTLVAVAAIAALAFNIPIEPAAINSTLATLAPNQISENLLRGRWLRPDGGYIIEVNDARVGGHLEAAYLNPRSKNVSRAEWHRYGNELHVFVELRDANYPGATYSLHYLPNTDQLVGNYFQPLSQQTIRVQFVRESLQPRRHTLH